MIMLDVTWFAWLPVIALVGLVGYGLLRFSRPQIAPVAICAHCQRLHRLRDVP